MADPNLDAGKRQQIQKRMLGPEVLDSERYPEISFVSEKIEPGKKDELLATGSLSIHGRSRRITVRVARTGRSYSGATTIRQSDFGMKPISIAGGMVRVKDELKISFEIVPER